MEKTISPIPMEFSTQGHHKTNEGIKNIIFGSVAGMAGKVFEYPFDTVKTRLQTQSIFKGPSDCFKQTFKNEGFWGFYRGMSSPMIGAMLENAMLFLVYNQIKMMIVEYTTPVNERHRLYINNVIDQESFSMSQLCLAGGISGSLTSFVLTPLELIKCKLQVQETLMYEAKEKNIQIAAAEMKNPKFTGPASVIKYTLKEHGIRGLYRGHIGTFFRETIGGAAWFGTYEFVSRLFMERRNRSMNIHELPSSNKKGLSLTELMASGACAGMAYNITMFPVDSVKSQIQTDEEIMLARGRKVVKRSFFKVCKDIYKEHNIPGFYRGCGITVARAAPSSAIIFMTYVIIYRIFSRSTLFK
ncbi:8510_t:CDS:2 [Acaulospora morrowiae]|uniref:8510_t:CDS:1 n=1 Tax=Acaulospora morrowiae TaxID=94023 RepID=A0A9N9A0P9_9GLOM|nr:8510_t:CDS:2 [Acaulospora morrowiae]